MALFIIADDSHRIGKMRGRGGYTDAVIPPRRKPVSVEDVDHIYHGSRKAARISDFATEDSDDISRRSHLKDRKLLDDITTKMVNSSYTEPVKVHRTAARRPTVVAPVTGRKPAKTTRRVGARPMPSLARTYRASSLPPQYVEEEVVTPYNLYEVVMPRSYYVYRPPPVKSTKVQYQSLNNIPQYQPKPRPISPVYRARASSEPPVMRSNTLAVKNARRCLDRIERELGVDDGELYAYPPPAPAIAREVRARTAVRGGGNAAAGRAAVRRRPGSLPPSSSRRGLNAINQAEIEREVDEYLSAPVIKKSLRTRAASLERPVIPSAVHVPSSPVIIRRSSLSGPVQRMPSLDPYRPKQGSTGNNVGNNYGISSAGGYSGTAIAPYTPARVSKAAPVGSLPPKGSTYYQTNSPARNQIRYVVCYMRKDPYRFRRY